MGSVDPAYIDRLQEDIIIACHRLEEAGHESLVVTVSEEGHLTFGSQKGKRFLEDKHGFIKEFVFHCQNSETVVKVEAEVDEEEETIVPKQQNNKTKQHKKLVSIIDRNLINKVKGKDEPDKTEIDKDESVNADENVDSVGGAERDMYDDDTDDNDDSEKFSALIPKDETEPDDVTEDQVTGEDSMEMDGDNDFVTIKVEQPENKAEESPVLKRMKTIINSNKSSQVKVKWSALKTTKKGMWKKPKEIEPGPTSCDVCGKELSCWSSLMRHKISHHSDGRDHECEECGKKFKLAESLVRHKVVHKTEKDYKCEICNKAFKKLVYVTKHMDTHKLEKPYKCGQCEKCFARKENLTAHERIHAGKQVIECKVDKSHNVTVIEDLSVDGDRAHNDTVVDVSMTENKSSPNDVIPKNNTIHHCKYCYYNTMFRCNLIRHMRSMHKVRDYPSSASIVTEPEKRDHMCDRCGKCLSSKYSLKMHKLDLHEQTYRYFCPTCNRGFNRNIQFRRHCKRHLDNVPEQCEYCGTEYTFPGALERHLKICKDNPDHTETAGYACTICAVVFSKETHLKEHIQGKHEPATYKCSECGKLFSWRSSLKAHQIHLHPEQSFGRPIQTKKPKLDNVDEKCQHCGSGFTIRGALARHIKICKHNPEHEETNGCVCPKCAAVFPTQKHLKEHIKGKHEPPAYKCLKCGKQFAWRSSLNFHKKNSHPA